MNLAYYLTHFWKPIIEVLILWAVIYHIMLFFVGTRAIQVLRGIIILLVAFFLFQKLRFDVLNWLLTKIFAISVIAFLIIFYPEIRQGLARLGQGHLFGATLREAEFENMLKEIYTAAEGLAKEKSGALIAIETSDSLNPYMETGVVIDARLSADLIQAIFTPNNPLHDGGLIIQNGRLAAAGCIFPLIQNQDLSRMFGTRHRAALGLSEETDAIIIIVSEERQDISLVFGGNLYKDLNADDLISKLKDLTASKKDA